MLVEIESWECYAPHVSARLSKLPRKPPARRQRREFTEADAWLGLEGGWQHLYGGVRERGYSIEWHDFSTDTEFDWAPTFHPGGLEICLNLAGHGWVSDGAARLELGPLTGGFYFRGTSALEGGRAAGARHQFITVELSREFLRQHMDGAERELSVLLRGILTGDMASRVSPMIRLTGEHRAIVASLRKPPVLAGAQRLWYHAKALEIASAFFFATEDEGELFCHRQQRLNRERVVKVIGLLRENLAESLSLEEIGRRVGCSHFHLSRVFSQETGQSIFQHLRQLRLERAAELLREGRLNVTQVALEVGFSSPSHFSMAFRETFGCCPGLYPLATPAQQAG
jgi:AraC-like DNA-binding protein